MKPYLKEARDLQRRLRKKINLKERIRYSDIKLIAACDVYFSKRFAYGVIVTFSFPELKPIEVKRHKEKISFPYIPGFLSFREGKVLIRCFKKLKNKPGLIIFDGQGICHPERMGIATHLGVLLKISTIGCAKSHLYGKFKEPTKEKGSYTFIRDKDSKIIGAVLRTKDNTRPVFVSQGNKISLKIAIDVILNCTKKFRIPEPLRVAHMLSTRV